MLIEIQKLLNASKCPSCNKKNSLQLILICNRDTEKCTNSCECSNCFSTFSIDSEVSLENIQSLHQESLHINGQNLECDLVSRVCSIKQSAA